VEVIIRVDPKDVSDVTQLTELNRQGAFPRDALQLAGGPSSASSFGRGSAYEVHVDGEAARYLLGLLSDALAGADSLEEWQRQKAGQVELDLDPPAAEGRA
jgi:hypothetical protein